MRDIIDYFRAYRRYDPAAKSYLEIALLYPGPKAVFIYRVSHIFYQMGLFFVARLICEFGRWLTGVEIHPGAKVGKRLIIDHGMGIVIGETAEIGDDCMLFQGVTLGGTHFDPVKRHPTLKNRVVIGSGAKILGPITLEEGVRVGANSVVTKSVPAGTTVVGIPGRPISESVA